MFNETFLIPPQIQKDICPCTEFFQKYLKESVEW